MTFASAPWAIDGARVPSSLARENTFNSTGASEGITQSGGLKVTPLDTPGVGVQIAPGGALVLNKYQSTPRQTYTVSNPTAHIIPPGEMPGSSASARSYIVAVTIGDPEFSQVGHPWMPSTPIPDQDKATFQYVRPILVLVSAGATSIAGAAYPHLPLARIDIPANTTTITSAMITDLRALAQPRTKVEMLNAQVPTNMNLASTSNVNFPMSTVGSVKVPTWATRMRIMGFIEGLDVHAAGWAVLNLHLKANNAVGYASQLDEPDSSGTRDRTNVNLNGVFDVTALRGQTVNLSTVGRVTTSAAANFLRARAGVASVGMTVFFEEETV